MAETREFKTEVRQLLDLMIHSLYSNRDIFLRELVANAADAIDKARFESLTATDKTRDWQIRIVPDKKAMTLTVSDNGIGMTRDEVIENIGTIAKSGTKAFLKALEEKGENKDMPELIGQFGVGFYSAFMVAEKVDIITRKDADDAKAVRWSSAGLGEYELDDAEKSTPGTDIVLHMRKDSEMYLESWKIGEIIRRYSDFIEYPIITPEVKVNDDKTETVTDRTLNSQKAIWLRKASEITEDEYKSFFMHVSNAGGEYLKAIHMSAEGASEFKALLFLPKHAPFNFLMPDLQKRGLQLYVKRVFITDECKELLPDYLRFVTGVVDSNDLPLNVSREILQQNPQLEKINKAVASRIISELKKMLETERDAYTDFYKEFGKVLKEGIHTDFANVEKLKDLALYESMNTEAGKMITLAEYVAAMPDDQKEIYFITGDKRESVASSPALEYFRSKGYDVLFMTDLIDDWIMQSMFQYAKKNFKSVDKGDFAVDGAADVLKAAQEKFSGLIEFLKSALGDKVSEVRFSARLTDSPCCLITEGNAMSPHLERLFKAMHQDIPESKRILELNAKHPLVEAMFKLVERDAKAPELATYAKVLFDQALLAEGSPVADAAAFAKEITSLLLSAVNGKEK
ncbi:MAG: molecular chaperone HtpG [Victivallaceae bacterium]|nr:molecular chaperone HtpG [Victivallaceae bacterium]